LYYFRGGLSTVERNFSLKLANCKECVYNKGKGVKRMQKVLLIVNPVAGKAQGKNALFPLAQALCKAGYLPTTYITGGRGDATHVTRSMATEHDMVICCGGDGTLNEVINGMLDTNASVPLGYIPAGSTNDFATSLGIPKDMQKATEMAVHGTPFSCDIGSFNGDYFVYVAAFGLFTEVLQALTYQWCGRNFDIKDYLSDLVGVVLSLLFFKLCEKKIKKRLQNEK
jgi:YegS/Rv2252/BmrU family lipid kinase